MAARQTQNRMFFRIVRWSLRQLGFAYFRIRVAGLERIPARGGAILAANHPNILDGILMLIVSPRPVRFLIAEEFYFHPFLHWVFSGMGCIPVYRTRTNNGDALRSAIEALQRGEVIGIFPEGTTSELGRMRTVKRGVGLLALRSGVPVVPIGIEGTDVAFPEGSHVPRPRAVALAFAPPVRYAETLSDPIPQALLDRALEDIRCEILRAKRWAAAVLDVEGRARRWKPLHVALSSLVILPLASFLSLTANPSLDPSLRHGTAS